MYVIHNWHARIHGNLPGGVQARLQENSSENVFFVVFFSHQLILQFYRGFPMVISKKIIVFQGLRVNPTFSRGGGPSFSRGSKC